VTGTQPQGGPGSAAEGYWRAACLLSFSHAAGLSWPPPGTPQRRAAAGHWGCNSGIAWIAGHLADAAPGEFLLVLGTGHASSYLFAHQALQSGASAAPVSAAIRRYGQPHGEPTELLGIRDMPYLGGELGPALGVSQGIAASLPGKRVVVVVGDGECETPAALAAFAHHDVLGPAPGAAWLPVVNANGARMGSAAPFSPERLRHLLGGLGFTVLCSGPDAADAARAARKAWRLAGRGVPVAWLSVTDKGWPAPEQLGGRPFRGHHAHKPRELDLADPGLLEDVTKWLSALNEPPVVDAMGEVRQDVRLLAGRIRLDLPAASTDPGPCLRTSRTGPAVTDPVSARSPMAAADRVLAGRRVRVLSPDEASSNRLTECLAAGLVTEVLAEELCSAWAWGCTEAGTPAAVVSYEAFAPLIATQLAQYLKLLRARPPTGRPTLSVVLTSLGWGNSPTHQNTDLVAGLLARAADGPARVVFPVGASSAARRLSAVLDEGRDEVAVFSCSKQPLADLPDPGGAAVGIRMSGVGGDDAVIIAVGDVAVTEAVAAMALAAAHRVRVGVVALVEPGRLDLRPEGALRQACHPRLPAVCASWVAAHHLAAAYWAVRPAATAHLGYRERWGATAWETLAANGLTRWSLLGRLRDAGCALPPGAELPPEAEATPPVPLGLSCEVRPL
jgi:xylulose-5-phosphate/fructose-6-phosphate phosphoketolase